MPSHHDLANAIRALSMDAVQCANSGHPGMPMGMADIATVLWREHLRHNPKNPQWHNRDRFILSNGHGSMLQYALLHLSGYDLSVDELKRFRQLHSKTPGHPEFRLTPGVETTTGPLGQGLANAVGMALAECHLSSLFNQPGFDIIDHYTYVFLGDGCLMEGISHEAASFAGTLGLGKLIAFWDDNGISIDGEVAPWFSDNTPKRFEAYGWHVIPGIDGHDPIAVNKAIHQAKSMTDKPSLLCCKTTIAFGAPTLAGTAKSHGSPLGESEIAKSREKLGWTHAPFVIPKDIYHAWDAKIPGEKAESEWQALWDRYEKAHPALAVELKRRFKGTLPHTWKKTIEELIQTLQRDTKPVATRKASQHCLNAIGPLLSELLGGSADLTGSNCTDWKGSRAINPRKFAGNYLHYGVREFGMTAIANGLALYGGIIPYTGTFLTFSDYARNAVRLSALMQLQHILIYSHDSIGLGEDGPTHQPIEHIASLRLIPGLHVWRPADSVETAVAWQHSLEHREGPSCLLLSRQDLPVFRRDEEIIKQIIRGGYILRDSDPKKPIEAIIMATGSEVSLAIEAQIILEEAHGINTRVVSMPCVEVFVKQSKEYQEQVLPKSIKKRLAIEAGVPNTWHRFVGDQGSVVGIERFGESAPAPEVFNALGITAEAIVKAVCELSKNNAVLI